MFQCWSIRHVLVIANKSCKTEIPESQFYLLECESQLNREVGNTVSVEFEQCV